MCKCIWPIYVQILCVFFYSMCFCMDWFFYCENIFTCFLTENNFFFLIKEEYSREIMPSGANSFSHDRKLLRGAFESHMSVGVMVWAFLYLYVLLTSSFATSFPFLEHIEMNIRGNSLRMFRFLLCKIVFLEGVLDMI